MYIYVWNQQHFILQKLEGSADTQAKHGTGRLARFLRAPGTAPEALELVYG